MLDPQILGRGSAFEAHGHPDGVTVLRSSDRSSWKKVTLVDAFRCHWTDYLKEAAGLIAFMLGAGAFTTLFQFPGSSIREAMPSALSRDIGLGIIMSGVTAAIIYSPWGKKSGAHINPAVTWAFYRLGRINRSDALFYTLFQFVGGTIAPIVLFWVIGAPFADAKVKFATTQPGPQGPLVAFAAEFLISFILMMALLMAINSERLEKAAGAIAAGLIGIYIAIESPLSGMSLNPARSFGSALTAGQWNGLWVYFIAPMTATLLAAEVYMALQRTGFIFGTSTTVATQRYSIIKDYKTGPDYPVEDYEIDEGQRA